MKFDIEMDQTDITEAVAYIQGFFSGARSVVDVPDSVHALTRALKTTCSEDEPDKEWATKAGLITTLVVHIPELLSILSLIQGTATPPHSEEYILLGNMIKDLNEVGVSYTAKQEITFNVRPKQLWDILFECAHFMPSVEASNYILGIMKQIDDQKEKN